MHYINALVNRSFNNSVHAPQCFEWTISKLLLQHQYLTHITNLQQWKQILICILQDVPFFYKRWHQHGNIFLNRISQKQREYLSFHK
jgi:hypothetical protein